MTKGVSNHHYIIAIESVQLFYKEKNYEFMGTWPLHDSLLIQKF